MVDDDVLDTAFGVKVHGIVRGGFLITHTAADVPDYHIAGIDSERIVLDAYPVSRSGLTGDGHISVGDLKRGIQADDAGHVEDDGSSSLLAYCPSE